MMMHQEESHSNPVGHLHGKLNLLETMFTKTMLKHENSVKVGKNMLSTIKKKMQLLKIIKRS